MANEIQYSGIGDLRATHILNRQIDELLHDPTDLRAVMTEVPWHGGASAATKVAQMDLDIAMSAPGQVTQVNNSALTDSSYTLTPAHYAVQYEVGYLAQATSNGMGELDILAQAIVQRTGLTMTDLACALFPSVTAAVSDTGIDMTIDHFFDAMFTLNAAVVPGPYYCVLHQTQINDLISSMRGESGSFQFRQDVAGMLDLKGPGFKGSLLDVNVWQSDSVNTVNAAADRSGCMFGAGAFKYQEAPVQAILGHIPSEAYIAGGKVFAQFDQISDHGKTRLNGHYFPAAAIAENARAVEIITDA